MVALDAFEQLDARLLHLIGAYTGRYRGADEIEIPFEEIGAEGAHCEARHAAMLEQGRSVPHEGDRRVQLMRASAQGSEVARVQPPDPPSLENRRSPTAKVWSAPSTSRPARVAAIACAFSRASNAATWPALSSRHSAVRSHVRRFQPELPPREARRRADRPSARALGRARAASRRARALLIRPGVGDDRRAGSTRPLLSPRSSGASHRCSASCAVRIACARTSLPPLPLCGRYTDRRRDGP